jgi:hypothetical protein
VTTADGKFQKHFRPGHGFWLTPDDGTDQIKSMPSMADTIKVIDKMSKTFGELSICFATIVAMESSSATIAEIRPLEMCHRCRIRSVVCYNSARM